MPHLDPVAAAQPPGNDYLSVMTETTRSLRQSSVWIPASLFPCFVEAHGFEFAPDRFPVLAVGGLFGAHFRIQGRDQGSRIAGQGQLQHGASGAQRLALGGKAPRKRY